MDATDSRDDAARAIQPECDGERCVHAQSPLATCRACVEACPHGAWLLTDDGLGLDTGACDGCGLCLPACPEEALSLPFALALRAVAGGDHAYGACDRAGVGMAEGVMPCLHAIGLRDLARLHAREVRALVVATAPCDDCARGAGRRLDDAIAEFCALAEDHGEPPVHLERVAPADWSARLAGNDRPGGLPHVDRRGLFRALLAGGEDRRPTAASERPPSGTALLALCVPAIDAARCSGCEACLRICRHAAIVLDRTGGARSSYRIVPQNCTGCGLCRDICEDGAVSIARLARPSATRVELVARRCSRCGAPFAEPAERASGASVCRICRRVDHTRNLFQVLR